MNIFLSILIFSSSLLADIILSPGQTVNVGGEKIMCSSQTSSFLKFCSCMDSCFDGTSFKGSDREDILKTEYMNSDGKIIRTSCTSQRDVQSCKAEASKCLSM
jgi:hypothetical protein